VDHEVTEFSEVQQLQVVWHRVNGRCNCDTADGSNGVTVNCISVRANVQ
jgi:hypothetical protein